MFEIDLASTTFLWKYEVLEIPSESFFDERILIAKAEIVST